MQQEAAEWIRSHPILDRRERALLAKYIQGGFKIRLSLLLQTMKILLPRLDLDTMGFVSKTNEAPIPVA